MPYATDFINFACMRACVCVCAWGEKWVRETMAHKGPLMHGSLGIALPHIELVHTDLCSNICCCWCFCCCLKWSGALVCLCVCIYWRVHKITANHCSKLLNGFVMCRFIFRLSDFSASPICSFSFQRLLCLFACSRVWQELNEILILCAPYTINSIIYSMRRMKVKNFVFEIFI